MKPITEVTLPKGAILYRESDANDYAYIIKSGEVVLFQGHARRRIEVERRGAGSVVGDLSVLTGQARAVTVQAKSDCVLYRIAAGQITDKFNRLDPILRACVDTAITFSRTHAQRAAKGGRVRAAPILAPSVLHNSEDLMSRFQIETELSRALRTDQFSMKYQPVVEIPSGRIIGVEALMRWDNPTLGVVRPDVFIKVAESAGAMQDLTEFAITEACDAIARLHASGTVSNTFFASVNISAQDIARAEFVDHLAQTLDRCDLDPACIKLELTETALIQDVDVADSNLRRVRALGCGVSIDDFGTGYSNLAYLKSLPLTAIKIDRCFSGDAYGNSVSRGIVRLLVNLGRDLGVDIIAEGLETEGDVDTLTALGCIMAQGYHFHHPLGEADLAHLIAHGDTVSQIA